MAVLKRQCVGGLPRSAITHAGFRLSRSAEMRSNDRVSFFNHHMEILLVRDHPVCVLDGHIIQTLSQIRPIPESLPPAESYEVQKKELAHFQSKYGSLISTGKPRLDLVYLFFLYFVPDALPDTTASPLIGRFHLTFSASSRRRLSQTTYNYNRTIEG